MGQRVLDEAKQIVVDYYNDNMELGEDDVMSLDDTFIVWFSKTLQNWKALVGTHRNDHYFEITHDGDRKRTYVDVYTKKVNYTVDDSVIYQEEED